MGKTCRRSGYGWTLDGVWDESDPGADPAALYRRTWPGLIGVLTSIGGSRAEAEAVAEDAYVKLLGRWDAIRRYDDPELWVRGLAVRTMVSRLQRHETLARLARRLHRTRNDDVAPAGVAGEDMPGAGVPGGGVEEVLGLMSAGQRAVVVLHDVLELSIEEIAEELQVGVGAARSRLARARQSLAVVREVAENA
ncbi:sigma factor-like helix-turn-helix DNA-binding protein [Kribbella sp. NPDC048928]|uniref:sigma factor-like helix-turn-helix DNA-binding protein n=1 Tax=Kribbella sp. NPDC048928 TaxID=3364111 RepID=UPI003722F696